MVNEFDWMRDVEPHLPVILGPKTIIFNSDVEGDPFMVETQKKLFSAGCGWYTLNSKKNGFNFNLMESYSEKVCALVISDKPTGGLQFCKKSSVNPLVRWVLTENPVRYYSKNFNKIPNHAIKYIY